QEQNIADAKLRQRKNHTALRKRKYAPRNSELAGRYLGANARRRKCRVCAWRFRGGSDESRRGRNCSVTAAILSPSRVLPRLFRQREQWRRCPRCRGTAETSRLAYRRS